MAQTEKTNNARGAETRGSWWRTRLTQTEKAQSQSQPDSDRWKKREKPFRHSDRRIRPGSGPHEPLKAVVKRSFQQRRGDTEEGTAQEWHSKQRAKPGEEGENHGREQNRGTEKIPNEGRCEHRNRRNPEREAQVGKGREAGHKMHKGWRGYDRRSKARADTRKGTWEGPRDGAERASQTKKRRGLKRHAQIRPIRGRRSRRKKENKINRRADPRKGSLRAPLAGRRPKTRKKHRQGEKGGSGEAEATNGARAEKRKNKEARRRMKEEADR